MFVEFQSGQKFASNVADVSDSHESFKDAGYVLKDNEVVIDIDNLPHETISKMIQMFDITTQIVWTERGAHLYFKKPKAFRGARRICALGFEVEYKHSKNTRAITIKRDGKLRKIENFGVREDMPEFFIFNKRTESLL